MEKIEKILFEYDSTSIEERQTRLKDTIILNVTEIVGFSQLPSAPKPLITR